MSNYAQWAASLDKAFQEKVVQRFVQKHRTIALQAMKEVTTDSRTVGFAHGSPVWTGRFKGSHKINVNVPDTGVLPPHPETFEGLRWPDDPAAPYPSPALSEASIKLTALKPFEKVVISNHLPYARRIETGYSPKTPEGVYGITAERLYKKYAYTRL